MILNLPWYKQPIWKNWVNQLFRYYTFKRNYQVTFEPKIATAGVDMKNKRMYLGTEYKKPRGQIRFCPNNTAELKKWWIKALVAHEAGHVRYSGEKPQGILGQLWNILEDERIERLMAEGKPENAQLFDFLGDIYLKSHPKEIKDALLACLIWRWEHDLITQRKIIAPQWEFIKPLVELAWIAENSEEVKIIAEKILKILGIKPENKEKEMPQVTAPETTGKGSSNKPTNKGDGKNLKGKPNSSSESDPNSSTESEANSKADSSIEDEPDSNPEGKPNSSAENEPTKQPDENEPCKTTDGQVINENEPEQNADTSATSINDEDIGESSDDLEIEEGGSGVGTNSEDCPYPSLEPGLGESIREMIEPLACTLGNRLVTNNKPAYSRPSENRGRFRYDKHLADHPRPFLERHTPRKSKPLAVTVLLDVSLSMQSNKKIELAQQTCVLVQRACELAGNPFQMAVFGSQHIPLVENNEKLRDVIAHLHRGLHDNTILAPSIAWALQDQKPDHKNVIIIIGDGCISQVDSQKCKEYKKNAKDGIIIPIIINCPQGSVLFKEVFGRVIDIENAEQLSPLIGAWLNSIQNQG
jgi:hypothetical protein